MLSKSKDFTDQTYSSESNSCKKCIVITNRINRFVRHVDILILVLLTLKHDYKRKCFYCNEKVGILLSR